MGFENDRSIAVSIAEPKRVFALLEDVMGRLRSDLHLEAQMLGVIGSMHMLLQALSEGPGNAPAVPRRENIGQLGHEYTRVLLSTIETSYSERINVQELANRMNVNRSYLTELFRQDTGMSIKQYLMEYRLQRVLLRLQSPERTIKSIALECGFEDPLYLSRVFRKRFGLSPVDWRRKNRVGGVRPRTKRRPNICPCFCYTGLCSFCRSSIKVYGINDAQPLMRNKRRNLIHEKVDSPRLRADADLLVRLRRAG